MYNKKQNKSQREIHNVTAAAPLLYTELRMQQPDNRGEIIWMLVRMMSLCVCVLATENKHKTLLTGVEQIE